jgi:type I restriction enzyme S subunit
VVPSSWIERSGLRLDCPPYVSGAVEARERLNALTGGCQRLCDVTRGGISGLVNAGRIKRLWVQDPAHGTPFLSSTDILKADISRLSLISNKAVAANPALIIRQGWTLITRAGTVGRMAYARPDMDGLACSEDVLRVIPDESKIPPGYLYAFLSSKYGIPLVTSGTYGAIIQHIEPEHIAGLPVPRFGEAIEAEIADYVHKAGAAFATYQSRVSQASAEVVSRSGIPNPSKAEWAADHADLSFTVRSSELEPLRAWNHSRRAKKIADAIRSGQWCELGNVIDLEWLRWRVMFQRIDASEEHGIEVLTQKPLFHLFPEGRWISRQYLLSLSSRYVVPDQTTLIAKQGTLGERELYCQCEFVTGERALARAYSDHCMRVIAEPKKIPPGYLFAFLRSEAGFRLLRSMSEGSKQQDLHWRKVPRMPVPRLTGAEEEGIHKTVLYAYGKGAKELNAWQKR